MKRTTIRDIADHASVSIGTASNVLNDRPNVDPVLRQRVNDAVAALNYRVNVQARGLILRRSFNLGVVIPSLSDPFFHKFADRLEEAIEDRGSHTIIASSRGSAERERMVCDALAAKQIDGLILTPCCRENSEYFNELAAHGLPIVQLGRYYHEISCPIVMVENRRMGQEAAERLHSLGHRRLLHLEGDRDSNPDLERADGFRDAARRLGIADTCSFVDTTDPAWIDALPPLLGSDTSPTAVFACDEVIALRFLKQCRKMNIDVPGRVSVISVGPFFPLEVMLVHLSGFTVDTTAMSRAAAELLFAQIDATEAEVTDQSPTVELPMVFDAGETIKSV